MRIDIRTRCLASREDARERAKRSLRFALGRFASRITRVYVVLEDARGPRGSGDARCRLRAVLSSGSPPLLVEDVDRELSVAIDRAAERLGRRVARSLARQREFPRSSLARGRVDPPA